MDKDDITIVCVVAVILVPLVSCGVIQKDKSDMLQEVRTFCYDKQSEFIDYVVEPTWEMKWGILTEVCCKKQGIVECYKVIDDAKI